MAEEATLEAPPAQKRFHLLSVALWCALGLACGAVGFALPYVVPGVFAPSAAREKPDLSAGHPKVAFIPFGEIVVNINSDRLSRYLRLKITLEVKDSEKPQIEKLMAEHTPKLKSWLLSYLSDVSMEDIRGAAGQNRLRREIQDRFNATLFTDGYDRIRDVLFEEFNIQ